MHGSSLFRRFHAGCNIIHEHLQRHRLIHLHHLAQGILNHSAKEHEAQLRPKEDGCDGLERLCDASFKLNALLVFELCAKHSQNLLWNIEERRPSPNDWETDPLKRLDQVQYRRDRCLVHFSCSVIKSGHLEQRFRGGTLCTIPPTSRIPTEHDAFLAISILQTDGTKLTIESRCAEAR